MGFSLTAAWNTDDVQLYADRQRESDPPVPTLHQSLCCKQTERRILQSSVQKQAQCLQEQGEEQE